ncbi:hypothetical protein [Bradyrhizobium genosp. P]
MQNIVAGLLVVALIAITVTVYTQDHHECLRGHIFKTLQPCGADAPEV